MPEVLSFIIEPWGVRVANTFVPPVLAADPTGGDLEEGLVWFNSTDNVLKYYDGTSVIVPGEGTIADGSVTLAKLANQAESTILLRAAGAGSGPPIAGTAAQLKTILSLVAADISDFNTAAVAAANAGTIDADTLGGDSKATIISSATASAVAAIVDSAPGTLDTLNEIAAALNDDPDVITDILALLGTKARSYVQALTGGATTEVVTHSLNTRDILKPTVYVNSGNYEDEGYIFQRTSVNTITVVSEAGNIPSGRRIVIVAAGA